MNRKSKVLKVLNAAMFAAAAILIGATANTANAQRDPFAQPSYKKPATQKAPTTNPTGAPVKPIKPPPPPIVPVNAPSIEARLEYFKRMREDAAMNGAPLPKPTSVMTLAEMTITGFFKTPRGYAVMMEATPIKLSYPVYPGEKFFDGQLVAVEENRAVFKKVTKLTNGKFVASVENKALRSYSMTEQIMSPSPAQSGESRDQIATGSQPQSEGIGSGSNQKADAAPGATAPTHVVSPLDEMNRQPQEAEAKPATEKTDKKGKKPAKVARNQ